MRTFIFVLAAVSVGVSSLPARELQIDKAGKNLVKFTSDAKIESFSGVTDRIDGYVLWEGEEIKPDATLASSKVYFEVELNGLDTGIGMRNRHMREIYLETDKFPYAHFTGEIVSVDTAANGAFTISTSGRFFIHGKEQQVTILGLVSPEGDHYRVRSKFEVKLPDYGIKVPTLMFLKISETIELELDFALKGAQKAK
jgi:polyisoprenoid-binding protein YceI